jgi:opacity protein-like surface antigen
MWKKIFLIIGLTALLFAQVNAQTINFGPQLGFYKAQDADDGTYAGGVAMRLKFMSVLGVEASISNRQERYAKGALTVRSWPVVMITGLIYPLPIVYGAMGFGWYNATFQYDQSKLPLFTDGTTQKVGWHFGGGLEWPITTYLLLTGDFRYVFLNYNFKAIPGSGDLKSNFTVITVGILLELWSPAKWSQGYN